MARIVFSFMLCLFLITHCSSQSPKREFRGAWVASVFNLDWPTTPTLNVDLHKERLTTLLDQLKTAGLNAIVFQVRPEGDALYASPYEPWSHWLTGTQGNSPLPFFDPLEFAVAEAHKRGMEIHAWFNPYRVTTDPARTPASDHVSVQHPDWVIAIGTVRFLDPGLPGVRDHVSRVVTDVVRRYDVDGVHFDDYFYPYAPNQISNQDDATFANHARGFTNRPDWRRDNINIFIKQVYDSIQAVKPHVKFGISPFGIWKNGNPAGIIGTSAYDVLYCDAIAWLQARSIDYLTPQLYWRIGGPQDYSLLMPWWGDSVSANNRHLYPGHILGTFSTSELPNQVRLNRVNPTAHGSVFFRAGLLVGNTLSLYDSLRTDLYKLLAIPPTLAWKDTVKPNSPANLRYEYIASRGQAGLRWDVPSPSSDGDSAMRYVVYRFTTPSVQSVDFDNPASMFSVEGTKQNIPPAINAGGPYYFAVSALDRNHNESTPTSLLMVSAPATPLLAGPDDGSTGQPQGIAIQWSRSTQASYYHLQVSADSTFTSAFLVNETSLVDTFRVLNGLEGRRTYLWRVRANNAGGVSGFSNTWRFTTGFPATPLLASPANFTPEVSTTPQLAWRAAPGSDTYRVQLATSSDFFLIVADSSGIVDTFYAQKTSLQGPRNHFWRVSGTNQTGPSLWSETWVFRTTAPTHLAEEHLTPTEYTLSQNFPNPFNPVTTIRFGLPVDGQTTLRVYDLLGREVAELVNETLAAGVHHARFDASRLPSGTYIFALTSGGVRLSNKMILLK